MPLHPAPHQSIDDDQQPSKYLRLLSRHPDILSRMKKPATRAPRRFPLVVRQSFPCRAGPREGAGRDPDPVVAAKQPRNVAGDASPRSTLLVRMHGSFNKKYSDTPVHYLSREPPHPHPKIAPRTTLDMQNQIASSCTPMSCDFWYSSLPKTPSRNSTCHRPFFCRNWATTCAISNCCLRFIVKRHISNTIGNKLIIIESESGFAMMQE